ncbi:MAG TPA: M48 family metalloprotease [Kofleriaceae bacterium]
MGKVVVWLCVLVSSVPAFAGAGSAVDRAVEQKIRADVTSASSEAAAAWDAANAARDANRFDDAAAGYRKVIALVPKLDHPHRRLCGVLAAAHRDGAIHECELARSLAPASVYNQTALAEVLLSSPNSEERKRGIEVAHEAARAFPEDADAVIADCLGRIYAGERAEAAACADRMIALAPDNVQANARASAIAYANGDFAKAKHYLAFLADHGMPAEEYKRALAEIEGREGRSSGPVPSITWSEVVRVAIPVAAAWFGAIALLLILGGMLSRAALRTAGHLGADDGAGTPRERRLRGAYRVVLMLTGLVFYASLPLLIVVVIAAALVTLAIFDEMGGIPVVLILVFGVIVISTVVSVLRALFFKPRLKVEGKKLVLADYPKLSAILTDAARAIGTRPVDVVYLTPGTDAGVFEQRTLWRALRLAPSERVLLLGVALFDNMKQRELSSILAHEYGHFRNADTGGGVALAVRRSLLALLGGLRKSAYAFFNPAWWMVRTFTLLYFEISTGASRLQEMLADRWAIRAYGSEAFVAGYRHTVTREVEFAVDLDQTIKDVTANQWSLPNLYAYEPEVRPPAEAIAAAVEKRMSRAPTKFDTHPSARQRIEWAEKLALASERSLPDDAEPVWALFPEPEAIEREMTAIIRERIRVKTGVAISDAEWEDGAAEA